MEIYSVNNNYLDFLKKIEPKIMNNKEKLRPHIGVILNINKHIYLAPLSSYKPKQDKIPDTRSCNFKLYNMKNVNEKLGMIMINNMIPVLENEIFLLNFKEQNRQYCSLLEKQYFCISSNKEEISKRANMTYNYVVKNNNNFFIKLCNNFSLLETSYILFSK